MDINPLGSLGAELRYKTSGPILLFDYLESGNEWEHQEAGSLDSMLAKVATIYEQEVDDAVDGLSSLLEPLIMAVLGVLVGGLIVAMYLPIFQLGSVI